MAYQLLFVDDSATMHRVMQITFAREDFVVTTVSNGEQALAKLRETRFDLALVDIGMPGMNGYQVCTALRAEPAGAQLQILLFSSPQTPFDETQGQSCGALGHVAKPFEAQALVDRVKVLVGAPTSRPAVASAPAPASAAAIAVVAPTPVFVPTAPAATAVGIPLPGRAAPTAASGSWSVPTDSPALPHPPLAPPPRPPQIPTVAVVAAAPAAPSTPPPSFAMPTAAASVPLQQPMPAVAAPSAVPLGAAWAAAAPVAPPATSSTPAALPSSASPVAVAATATAARPPPVPAPVLAPIAAAAAAAPTTPASGQAAAGIDQASLHDLLERIAWDVIADVSAQYTLVKR